MPLTIGGVALAPGQIAGVRPIEDGDPDPLTLQMIVKGYPINPRSFHGHFPDPVLLEISAQERDLTGKGAEAFDRLRRSGGGHKEMLRANVDAGESRQNFVNHGDVDLSGLLLLALSLCAPGGDPVKAAEAIIAAVESDPPPLRLVLGKYANDKARKKLTSTESELAAWEHVGLPTHFTAAS